MSYVEAAKALTSASSGTISGHSNLSISAHEGVNAIISRPSLMKVFSSAATFLAAAATSSIFPCSS